MFNVRSQNGSEAIHLPGGRREHSLSVFASLVAAVRRRLGGKFFTSGTRKFDKLLEQIGQEQTLLYPETLDSLRSVMTSGALPQGLIECSNKTVGQREDLIFSFFSDIEHNGFSPQKNTSCRWVAPLYISVTTEPGDCATDDHVSSLRHVAIADNAALTIDALRKVGASLVDVSDFPHRDLTMTLSSLTMARQILSTNGEKLTQTISVWSAYGDWGWYWNRKVDYDDQPIGI